MQESNCREVFDKLPMYRLGCKAKKTHTLHFKGSLLRALDNNKSERSNGSAKLFGETAHVEREFGETKSGA